MRLPECLSVMDGETREGKTTQFNYVGRDQTAYQGDMEQVFTAWLKRTGAVLEPCTRKEDQRTGSLGFENSASIIIPVRNREKVIGDALESALAQKCKYSFNVLVVDNHSTDGTGEIIDRFARADDRVIKLVPNRPDLAIGGCWNMAAFADQCGRYMVQLDSDDVYSGSNTLERIIRQMIKDKLGMLVGSYQLVNKDSEPIPPGVVDHREWTAENGHNNLLRVNGIGAPRAFSTYLVRELQFPNVSYGEDYALALRVSRKYMVGRIYDPIYNCRRWEGNTDANISYYDRALHDTYKDRLRTFELRARRQDAGE